jgi:hypothetical protein
MSLGFVFAAITIPILEAQRPEVFPNSIGSAFSAIVDHEVERRHG